MLNIINSIFSSFKSSNFIKIFLIYQFLTRFVLTLYALNLNQIEIIEIANIFLVGLVNDLAASIYGLFFLLCLRLFIVKIIQNHSIRKYFEYLSFGLLNFIFLSNLLSELFFWDEFGTRYNFIAVDYLVYTQEIIHTVIESVPVFKIVGLIALFILFILFIFRNYINNYSNNIVFSKKLFVASFVLCFALYFGYKPELLLSRSNSFTAELQKNGPYEFVYAFFHNELDYKKFYPIIDSNKANKIVRGLLQSTNAKFIDDYSFERDILSRKNIEKSAIDRDKLEVKSQNIEQLPNIVVIVVESLSASYMQVFGNPQNLTPNIEKIAQEGVLFTNLYATGTRTVRGLEAIVKSIPPTPGSSIIRRSGNENIFTISTILKDFGYNLDFIYGGYGYFDNMNYFFEKNGFNITDRNNFGKEEITFANVWGVADGDVAKKLIKIIDKRYNQNKPFFSLFMTTSNHRPYTFPEGVIEAPQGSKESAVRYTDYSIGQFIQEAKTKPWFENTIFAIVADHCASSAGKTTLPKDKYHIPFILYSPKYLKNYEGMKIGTLASQIDVMPTILGLGNITYKSKFFGADLFSHEPNRAFISTYQLLGYFTNFGSVILAPNKKPIVEGENSDVILDEAISFYQSAYEMFKDEQSAKFK